MNFTLSSPYYLLLLLFLPCFIWCKAYTKTYYFSKLAWVSKQSAWLSFEPWLKMILFSVMVLALCKPLIYDSTSTFRKKGRDLVLALDASGSMAQSGFNKEDRFKNKFDTNIDLALNFTKHRLDDNMGVVIFGTFAYSASPLTYDLETLGYLLRMTNVGIAGESTAIGDAIMQSIRTLSFGKAKSKVIVLITDGYHNAGKTSPKEAVQEAKKLGIKIYTIGIGKTSDYDAGLLQTIAKETLGKSYSASSSDVLVKVYQNIEKLEPSAIRSENYLNEKLLILYPLLFVFIVLLLWVLWLMRGRE